MMILPCIWTTIPASSSEASARNFQSIAAPLYYIKPIFLMPAAGMYPGLVPVLRDAGQMDVYQIAAWKHAAVEKLRDGSLEPE